MLALSRALCDSSPPFFPNAPLFFWQVEKLRPHPLPSLRVHVLCIPSLVPSFVVCCIPFSEPPITFLVFL